MGGVDDHVQPISETSTSTPPGNKESLPRSRNAHYWLLEKHRFKLPCFLEQDASLQGHQGRQQQQKLLNPKVQVEDVPKNVSTYVFQKYRTMIFPTIYQTHRIHGTGMFTYILPSKSTIHVGKYTSPMDGMGNTFGPQNYEKLRFYTPNIWVITPENEGCGFSWHPFSDVVPPFPRL